jgi:hypothetical protein
MFDGMPLGKMGKFDEGASVEVGGDRISMLPDALLNHVLSFLPAEEAARRACWPGNGANSGS